MSAPEVVTGGGMKLLVRPERGLSRLVASPAVSRALVAARTAGAAALGGARCAGRVVFIAAVSAPAPFVGRVLGRFVCGRPLSGRSRTDATFWRPARRQPVDVAGESGRWSYLAGWQRSSVRVGVALILLGVALLLAPDLLLTTGIGVMLLTLVWGAYGVARGVSTRAHRTRYLWPLHEALRGPVGQAALRPEQWLHIPPGFKGDPGVELRIDLPAAFDGSGGLSEHVSSVVRNKLGLAADAVFSFRPEGNEPYVTVTEPVRPPARVTFDDIFPLLASSRDTAPIIGLAAGRRPVPVDLEADSPHILVSAGTGAGKSVLLRAILSQGLAKGGYGIVFDMKKVSHMWASNLGNCEYHRTAEAVHERLLSLQREVDRRNALVERYADIDGNTDHVDVGPRVWVMAEEMNVTISRLNKYWRSIKEKGDPNTSPAVDALLDLLFMGRQIKVHVVSVAQMASARTLGGPEARENYATRCLARYSVNAWRMLCPELWPMPRKSKRLGRWQIVTAGVATETQVAFFTPRQARELAQQGVPASERVGFPAGPVGVFSVSELSQYDADQGNPIETVLKTGTGTGLETAVEAGPEPVSEAAEAVLLDGLDGAAAVADGSGVAGREVLVSLKEAVEQRVVTGMSLPGLQKSAQRDVHFPEVRGRRGRAHLFPAGELGKWERNRRLAGKPVPGAGSPRSGDSGNGAGVESAEGGGAGAGV